MELPTEVLIHNELLGMKGTKGRLLQIAAGYYEVNCVFGDKVHRVLLPQATTVIISPEAEVAFGAAASEIER